MIQGQNIEKKIIFKKADRPTTPEEQLELEHERIRKLAEYKKEGLYERQIYSGHFYTDFSKFTGALKEFLLKNRVDPFWTNVSLTIINGDPSSEIYLAYINRESFGYIGKIEIEIPADCNLRIKISNTTYPNLISIIDEEEEKRIFFQSIGKLKELSDYLHAYFTKDIRLQIPKSKSGRKSIEGYDEAFREMISKNLTKKQAYELWKHNFPNSYNMRYEDKDCDDDEREKMVRNGFYVGMRERNKTKEN